MSEIRILDLKLAPEVKDAMRSFLSQITEFDPTIVLIKGRLGDEREDRWSFGAYGPDELARIERLGMPYLYSVDGFICAIPQPADLSELEGKTFGLNDRGLVLLNNESDI